MKRLIPALVAAVVVAVPPVSSASADTGDATLRDDRRLFCVSALQNWVNIKPIRNDDVPDGTKITDFGQPVSGEARLVITAGYNKLQYRDPTGEGTSWTYYEVHLPNGNVKVAYWRVNVDGDC